MSSMHCVGPNHVTSFLFHPPKCAACFYLLVPKKEEMKEGLFNHVPLCSWEPASFFRAYPLQGKKKKNPKIKTVLIYLEMQMELRMWEDILPITFR